MLTVDQNPRLARIYRINGQRTEDLRGNAPNTMNRKVEGWKHVHPPRVAGGVDHPYYTWIRGTRHGILGHVRLCYVNDDSAEQVYCKNNDDDPSSWQ